MKKISLDIKFAGTISGDMDAKTKIYFNAIYEDADGKKDHTTELAEMGTPFALCGDGVEEFKRLAPNSAPTSISSLLEDQSAVSVAKVALRLANKGASGTDAELAPVYLRLPQAERERLEKLKQ